MSRFGGIRRRIAVTSASIFRKTQSGLTRGAAWTWLADRSPLWLLFLYICLVPAYALAYYLLPPGSFYAPYMQYESGTKLDSAEILNLIRKNIRMAIVHSQLHNMHNWVVDSDSTLIDQLRVESPDVLRFIIRVYATKGRYHGYLSLSGVPIQAYIRLNERAVVFSDNSSGVWPDSICRIVYVDPISSLSKEENADIGDQILSGYPPCFQGPKLNVSRSEDVELGRYIGGVLGDPSLISGWARRSIYFSSITLTTVGFGDIVPISPTARDIVGSEPILGWLVAGLFLGALAGRAKRRHNLDPS